MATATSLWHAWPSILETVSQFFEFLQHPNAFAFPYELSLFEYPIGTGCMRCCREFLSRGPSEAREMYSMVLGEWVMAWAKIKFVELA